MEYLKQVNPDDWENIPPLAELYQDLPKTLRCSPHKNNTDFRRKTPKQATQNAYIGYNTPKVTTFIVIDLDYDGSIFAYHDAGIPRPQFVLKNPKNGHCQYLYRLKDPVTFFEKSRPEPIAFLNAVEHALTLALGGDMGFTGYLAKNALNPSHEVYYTGAEPYSLHDLANYLDLPTKTPYTADNDEYYGRNCYIFNAVRHLAYSLADTHTFTQIYNQCLEWCEEQNTRFSPKLPYNELKSISKSIAGYCVNKHLKQSNRRSSVAFRKTQALKGAKGGKAKGKAYDSKRQQAKQLHEKGVNNTQIALKLGVSRRTIINWLKDKGGCENSHQLTPRLGAVGVSVCRLFPVPGTRSPILKSVEEKNRGDQQIAPKPSVGNHAPVKVLTSKELMSLLYNSVYKPLPSLIDLSILQGGMPFASEVYGNGQG